MSHSRKLWAVISLLAVVAMISAACAPAAAPAPAATQAPAPAKPTDAPAPKPTDVPAPKPTDVPAMPPGNPLQYEAVRQAIAMGIDKQAIVDKFYPTGSSPADFFTPCAIPGGIRAGRVP
jgi:ABC-type oligopeptide transport system substrate-binding subunit